MNIKLPKKAIIPKGNDWKVEYHDGKTSFDPKDMKLHLEPEQEKGNIKGEILAERMKGKGLNANVLEYLLKHPKLIPEDWKGKCVCFWGTIYRSAYVYLFVRYLYWDRDRWYWGYYWLGGDWDGYDSSAVSSSSLNSNSQSSALETLPSTLVINGIKYIKL